MFTGLVEEVGSVIAVSAGNDGTELKIAASRQHAAFPSIGGNNRMHKFREFAARRLSKSRARSWRKRATGWPFRARARRLCVTGRSLQKDRCRFSIGNRTAV